MFTLKKRGYIYVTAGFFAISLALHWTFALQAGDSSDKILAAMFENWQSEFLQLIWQVAGLAFLLYIGSPQSKEGDERKEEKLDWIMTQLNPIEADRLKKELELKYPKK